MPHRSQKLSEIRLTAAGSVARVCCLLLAVLYGVPARAGEPANSPSDWWSVLSSHRAASGWTATALEPISLRASSFRPLVAAVPGEVPLEDLYIRAEGWTTADFPTAAGSPGLASVGAVFRETSWPGIVDCIPGLTDFAGAAVPLAETTANQDGDSPPEWRYGEGVVIRGASPEDFLVPVASRSGRSGQLLRFRADYISEGLDEFRDVARLRGNLQLTLQSRLAFDGEFNHWADPPAGHEDLWTGDANLVYVFGYGTPVRLKIGGGANWQSSRGEMEYGLNSTYGLDISIKRPFILSGSLDLGTLNGDRVFHGQATLGALLGILEIYAGYDWLDFGSLKMNGPVAGAGIWF